MQPRLLREPIRLAGQPLLRLQSDARLVRLAADGHAPAFATLVDRYRPALLRYCTRVVGDHRAEDVVQQTFVNAHRALTEREDRPADLRPWLYRIAHNASLNLLRGDTDGWSLDDPAAAAEGLPSLGAGVEETVERREQLELTLATISALPAAQRDALLLRELEGRSHLEIAGALGVSAGAARQHLMRARAAVRAAATAILPYPLMGRLAGWMTPHATGERLTQAATGAGLGAGVAKVSAGLLATGALVGGAAVGTGVAPSPLDGGARAPQATAPRPAAVAVAVAARAGAVPVSLLTSPRPGAAAAPATGARRAARRRTALRAGGPATARPASGPADGRRPQERPGVGDGDGHRTTSPAAPAEGGPPAQRPEAEDDERREDGPEPVRESAEADPSSAEVVREDPLEPEDSEPGPSSSDPESESEPDTEEQSITTAPLATAPSSEDDAEPRDADAIADAGR